MFLFVLLPAYHCINTERCQQQGTPRAKCIIEGMLEVIKDHIAWDNWDAWYDMMKDFWTEDMTYDSNWTPSGVFGNNSGLREFFNNEVQFHIT